MAAELLASALLASAFGTAITTGSKSDRWPGGEFAVAVLRPAGIFSVTTTFGVPARGAVRGGPKSGSLVDPGGVEDFFSFCCDGAGSDEVTGGCAVSGVGSGRAVVGGIF